MASIVLFVEDTYGVSFHRVILERLEEARKLPKGASRLVTVRRLPSKKCNERIYRGIAGYMLSREPDPHRWRVLVVIDSEGRAPEEAAERDVLAHVKGRAPIEVVVVEPRHEAWLCLGLGGERRICRQSPESSIERLAGRPYEKRMLATMAGRVDVGRLMREADFQAYVKALEKLLGRGGRGASSRRSAGV